MTLQYAAPCDECGKVMRAGSTASYFKRKGALACVGQPRFR